MEPNGCGYVFIVCSTNLTSELIPVGAHPLGQYVTIEDGVTNTVQKTVREFVTLCRDIGDGTAVVKLSARQGACGRKDPTTLDHLKTWEMWLKNYGINVCEIGMTRSEYEAAYPPEQRK